MVVKGATRFVPLGCFFLKPSLKIPYYKAGSATVNFGPLAGPLTVSISTVHISRTFTIFKIGKSVPSQFVPKLQESQTDDRVD